jgi:hypothetical protein
LAEYGFQIVGNYRDSHFPFECFHNSYYHLRWSCAERRTNLLKEQLQAANVAPVDTGFDLNEVQAMFLRILEDWGSRLQQ